MTNGRKLCESFCVCTCILLFVFFLFGPPGIMTNSLGKTDLAALDLGSSVYNRAKVYKRQNFLKVVVHVIIFD